MCEKSIPVCRSNKETFTTEYACGSLLFFKKLTDSERKQLTGTFPYIGKGMDATPKERAIIDAVLAKEKLSAEAFMTNTHTDKFFSGGQRPLLMSISDVQLLETGNDERAKEPRKKATLSFTLPKGAYATVVIKHLFRA